MRKENKAKIRHWLAGIMLIAFTLLAGYIGIGKMFIGAVFILLAALDAHAMTWVLGGAIFFQCIRGLLVACCIWLIGFISFPFVWGKDD